MRYVIGIDAGGTKTVGLLADESGKVRDRAQVGAANLRIHGDAGVERILGGLVDRLSRRGRVAAVCVGAAGVDRPPERRTLARMLGTLARGAPVSVVNDAWIALVAGAPERAGIVVVAGTGSIAYGVDREGRSARSGGWGPLLADEGSAFWLGQEALRRCVRAADGRGPETRLRDAISERLGLAVPDDLVSWAYQDVPALYRFAELAPVVSETAEAGDEVARELVGEAARELAAAARSVAGKLLFTEPYPLVLSGGVLRGCPTLVRRLKELLDLPRARVALLADEPALGAVSLALDLLGRRPT